MNPLYPQQMADFRRSVPFSSLPSNTAAGLLRFYPDPHLALQLWSVYVRAVDPVLKILHIPTTQSAVIATILAPGSSGAPMVALTFAIYFCRGHRIGPLRGARRTAVREVSTFEWLQNCLGSTTCDDRPHASARYHVTAGSRNLCGMYSLESAYRNSIS